MSESSNRWRRAVRERRRAAALCVECAGDLADGSATYCERHREQHRAHQRRHRQKPCAHVFILPAPSGPTANGRCRRCGRVRVMNNALPGPSAARKIHEGVIGDAHGR